MFTKRIQLFRLAGFEVGIDLSWFLLAILIAWSLATGWFPSLYPELPTSAYWWMAVVGTLGLFLSIILHELSHSLVARRYGMPIKGITLFLFGGVAEMSDEPRSPMAEFNTAIVGPIASLAIAVVCYVLAIAAAGVGLATAVVGVLAYLATINMVVALFNMVPAFPLDGGRVLRAALWGWKGKYRWATRIASNAGSIFGIALMVLAVLTLIQGNFISAMWWFLIGMFIRGAAQMSYHTAVTRQLLSDMTVRHLMTANPVTVDPGMPLDRVVEEYFYKHYFKMYPVVEDGRLIGALDVRQVKPVPRERWSESTVRDVMAALGEKTEMEPGTPADEALMTMAKTGNTRFLVTEADRLAGVISQSDILRFLAVRMDLDQEVAEADPALRRTHGNLAESAHG